MFRLALPRSLSISGLSGDSGSNDGPHFGLESNEWSNIGSLTSGLPWDVKFGLLSAQDVSNAKGDLSAMDAQVGYQREYLKVQEQIFDRWEEIQKIQVELAKLTMNGRYTAAQLDQKAAEAYYQHVARMNILLQENQNAQNLAQLQQRLGIDLANHKHRNSRKLMNAEFDHERGYADAQYRSKRKSLVERFQQKLDRLNSPRSRASSEFEPTPGRVLQFRGRRVS